MTIINTLDKTQHLPITPLEQKSLAHATVSSSSSHNTAFHQLIHSFSSHIAYPFKVVGGWSQSQLTLAEGGVDPGYPVY